MNKTDPMHEQPSFVVACHPSQVYGQKAIIGGSETGPRSEDRNMKHDNPFPGFATLFPTVAALTAPAQEFRTRTPTYRAPSRLQVLPKLGRHLGALFERLDQRLEAARVRRILGRLDDRLLRDIGLSRADVGPELPEPFIGFGQPLAHGDSARRGPTHGDPRVGLWHL
jgi:uncharacterized protein YjiS (DUF1127 family)